MGVRDWTQAKKLHNLVLVITMGLTIVVFNMGRELTAALITVAGVISMGLIDRKTTQPVYDERDLSLAKDSTHKALMLTGVLGGIGMLVISVGMGLDMWSYPDWVAPYYLTWGAILVISIIIESLKRFGVDV